MQKIMRHKTRSGNLRGQWGWTVDIRIIQKDGRSWSSRRKLYEAPACSVNEGKGPGGQEEAATVSCVSLKGIGHLETTDSGQPARGGAQPLQSVQARMDKYKLIKSTLCIAKGLMSFTRHSVNICWHNEWREGIISIKKCIDFISVLQTPLPLT